MKLSKTNKALFFFIVFTFMISVAVSALSFKSVKAEETPTYTVSSEAFKVVDDDDGNEHSITLAKGIQYQKSDLIIKDQTDKKYSDKKEEPYKTWYGMEFLNYLGNDKWVNDSKFCINISTTKTITLCGKSFTLEVVDDTVAPEYKNSSGVISFNDSITKEVDGQSVTKKISEFLEDELAKNVLTTFKNEDGNDVECCRPIGSNKYIKIPSFEEYISDDTCFYRNMKYKVHYKVGNTDTTYSSSSTLGTDDDNFKIPVKEEGKYTFYVTFIDSLGNEMDAEDAKANLLTFSIYENYPVKVKVSEEAKKEAYLGETYKGTSSLFSFGDNSSNLTKKYNLLFAEKDEEEEFKELKDAGFTEDEIANINFKDSDLSFKAIKKGFYKITCEAENQNKTAKNDNFVVIGVTEKTAGQDDVDDSKSFGQWISDNLLAFIFFCIAFVCLVAIVVLLVIKPKSDKQKTDEVKTTDSEK